MFFLHIGGKIKKELNCSFFFASGIIFSHRRTLSTKQYTECRLTREGIARNDITVTLNPNQVSRLAL